MGALQAIRDFGKLGSNGKNKSILIVGAGGGVGNAGVQIAKQLGATVTAVVSSKDVQNAKSGVPITSLTARRIRTTSQDGSRIKNKTLTLYSTRPTPFPQDNPSNC